MGGELTQIDWGISEKDFLKEKILPIEWPEKYRILNGLPYSREGYEWVVMFHNSRSPVINFQKAAQMAITESAINKAFYAIDVEKKSVLYMLPTDGDAGDFCASRFDAALEESEYIRKMFSDVSNRRLKRAGSATLYIRGSRSKSRLKSIPVALLILDEYDEMNMEHVSLARDRLAGQREKQEIRISTPTIEGYGINKEMQNSTVFEYLITCIFCNHKQFLTWENNVEKNFDKIEKSYLKCEKCGKIFTDKIKRRMIMEGKWEKIQFKSAHEIGLKINQLYSSTVTVVDLVRKYKEAIEKQDEFLLEDFYHSCLGEPYIGERNRLTINQVTNCIGNYRRLERSDNVTALGVDIGRVKHWVCTSMGEAPSVIAYGKLHSSVEILELMNKYNTGIVVIDSEPPDENISAMAQDNNKVWLADFVEDFTIITKWLETDIKYVKINRNIWLERIFNYIYNKKILFPYDIDEDFKKHFTRIAKVVRLNKQQGNWRTTWISKGDDHYSFALLYSLVGLEQLKADSFDLTGDSKIYISKKRSSINFWRPLHEDFKNFSLNFKASFR